MDQLIYLTKTRPNISYATSVFSRYMHSPQSTHWSATLQLVSYLARFPSLGLWYAKGEENTIQGFFDSDYTGNLDDKTSTGGYLFTSGSTPISWSSKKHNSTSRSFCKSEYCALAKCASEAIWLKKLEKELGSSNSSLMTLWCDNQSRIKISKNPVFHDKTKHFEVDWHFSRQKIDDGTIRVNFINSNSQPVDIFTKALNKVKFLSCRDLFGLETLEEVQPSF